MNLHELLRRAQEALSTALAARQAAQANLMNLRSAPDITVETVTAATEARDAATAAVDSAQAEVARLEDEIREEGRMAALQGQVRDTAPRPTGGARVTSEPEVYRRGSDVSYFRDLMRAQTRTGVGISDATERLLRNSRSFPDQVRSAPANETRALSTTDGAGGDFVPPLWLISVTANVITLAGGQSLAQQLLDQSPINMDEILLEDLAADYAVKADVFVISNNATNAVGLLSASGTAVTYTSGSPTVAGLYSKLADAVQQVHTTRYMPATAWVMHPRRWAWFLAAVDTAGRPLVTPDAMNSVAQSGGVFSSGRVGMLHGLPVYVDPNIPTTLNTNQDPIILLRDRDAIFYESTPRAEASIQPGFNNLTVNLRFYRYAAIHASRFPKSVAVVSGTGLITPTF
jgi:hypothetical protein